MDVFSNVFQTGGSDVITFVTYSVFAVVLGILCNGAANFIDKSNLPVVSTNVYASAVTKLALVGFIMLFVQNSISPQFGSDWQSSTPGVAFCAIFFALQPNLMGTLQYIANKWSM